MLRHRTAQLRLRLWRPAVHTFLALFLFVQLSPAAMSWCQTSDGTLHLGCACSDCLDEGQACAAPAQGDGCDKGEICPACGHTLTAGVCTDAAGLHPATQECCEHSQYLYASQHSSLRLAGPTWVAVPAIALPVCTAALAVSIPPRLTPGRAHAPPGLATCPAASGAAALPLRV